MSELREKEKKDRDHLEEKWYKANSVLLEYGNICIKLLVTLNSSAIIAAIAFIGNFNIHENISSYSGAIWHSLPISLLYWSVSLSLILLSALCTYICYRWYPTLLVTWHKKQYITLFQELSKREKLSLPIYNGVIWLGIIFGIISLLLFLLGIWVIMLSIQ